MDAFSLFGNPPYFLKLTAEKPKVAEKYAFPDGHGGHNQVHEQQCVQVSAAFVTAVLFQPASYRHLSSFQQPQVLPASDD